MRQLRNLSLLFFVTVLVDTSSVVASVTSSEAFFKMQKEIQEKIASDMKLLGDRQMAHIKLVSKLYGKVPTRKLSDTEHANSLCTWSGVKCGVNEQYLASTVEGLPTSSVWRRAAEKHLMCATVRSEADCKSVGCVWESGADAEHSECGAGNPLDDEESDSLMQAVYLSLLGEGDGCGFYGRMTKKLVSAMKECDGKAESDCNANQLCEYARKGSGFEVPEGASVGAACVASGKECAPSERTAHASLCGKSFNYTGAMQKCNRHAFNACAVDGTHGGYGSCKDTYGLMHSVFECLYNECPVLGEQMDLMNEGERFCNAMPMQECKSNDMKCLWDEGSTGKGECKGNTMFWFMTTMDDRCAMKSIISAEIGCKTHEKFASCVIDPLCTWDEDLTCLLSGPSKAHVKENAECGMISSLMLKRLAEETCDSDHLFMYQAMAASEACHSAREPLTCANVKEASVACIQTTDEDEDASGAPYDSFRIARAVLAVLFPLMFC